MSILASEGLDGLSMPKLAALAGVSTGPVYNRWDSNEDVVLDLWTIDLRGHLDWLLETVDAAMSVDGERRLPAMQQLVNEIDSPSLRTLALTETLMVLWRFPWLSASIAADVDAALYRYLLEGRDTEPAHRFGQLDVVFGALCFGRSVSDLPIDWRRALESARITFNGPFDPAGAHTPRPEDDTKTFHLPWPSFRTDDEVLDRFFGACCTVTARAGYAKASAHRISREAQLTFSHVYKYFDAKEDLTEAVVAEVVSFFHRRAVGSLRIHDRAAYVDYVMGIMRGLWSKKSLPSARLRMEMTITARHVPDIGAAVRERVLDTWHATRSHLRADEAPARAHMNLAISLFGVGLSFLVLTCPSATGIDMFPLVTAWDEGMEAVHGEMGLSEPGSPGETGSGPNT